MTDEKPYTKREIDLLFGEITKQLTLILAQTTKHNGRMSRVERILLVVGTIVAVLLVVNGSSLLNFLMTIIK